MKQTLRLPVVTLASSISNKLDGALLRLKRTHPRGPVESCKAQSFLQALFPAFRAAAPFHLPISHAYPTGPFFYYLSTRRATCGGCQAAPPHAELPYLWSLSYITCLSHRPLFLRSTHPPYHLRRLSSCLTACRAAVSLELVMHHMPFSQAPFSAI